MISFDDFKKVELTVGKILSAEKISETDKLLKLSVDFGLKQLPQKDPSPEHSLAEEVVKEERDIRQVVSGIAPYFPDPALLIGKKFLFVTNLEPRAIRGFESHAMIMAVGDSLETFSLLSPGDQAPAGSKAR